MVPSEYLTTQQRKFLFRKSYRSVIEPLEATFPSIQMHLYTARSCDSYIFSADVIKNI